MNTNTCELASLKSARAFFSKGHLLICVEGQLPSPGFEVKIERSLLTVEPPQFSVLQCRLNGFFPQVVTPFKHSEVFFIGVRRDTVIVHRSGGSETVEVENCIDELSAFEASLPAIPTHERSAGDHIEVTGRSQRLSFDEAFADALSQVPDSPVIDGLKRLEVVEIGGLFGGIAGFHELFVKVKANVDGLS